MSATTEFRDRSAIVTGAAGGIGRAIAHALVTAGASVTLVDLDDQRLAATAEDLGGLGGRCRTECVDLADHHAYAGLVDRAGDAWGGLDILVNNAADTGRRLALADVTYDEWARVLGANLTAPLLLSRDASRVMRGRGGGCIVNLSSIQAHLPLETHVPYAATKGGMEALTRALAVELAPEGIRVNAVAPGVIATPGMLEQHPSARDEAVRRQATLSGRAGTSEDVAAAVMFLASDAAAHINGTTLTVDGGRRLSRRPDPLAEGLAQRSISTGVN